MKIEDVERIKELIQRAELEQAKAQGAKDSIKAEWKKKYGFETLDEANNKFEELKTDLEKQERRKEKLISELSESQDWEKIENELEE